jgi:hypothetical protein
MTSKEIADYLKPFALKCAKRTDVVYKYIDAPFKSKRDFKLALKRPCTLIAYGAFSSYVDTDTRFVTKLKGDREPEQEFSVSQVFVPPYSKVLVVGPIGEVYYADLKSKFKKRRVDGQYVPRGDLRRCALIDNVHFKKIKDMVSAKNSDAKTRELRVPTSWGAMHLLKKGDTLIVEADGVYRIKGSVFAKTYRILG